MNPRLHDAVIGAIHWMEDHLHDHPELLPILTGLRIGEKRERTDPNDVRTSRDPA